MRGCGAAFALSIAGTGAVGSAAGARQDSEGPRPIVDLLEDMPDNWGRWGDDDELGAINYIGSAEMVAGMEAVTNHGDEVQRYTLQDPVTGEAIDALVSDATNPTTDTGDPMFPGRFPARRTNSADASDETGSLTTAPDERGMEFADDVFATPLYLQGATHVDALGHAWYDGQMYNGFDPATTHTAREFDDDVTGTRNINSLPGDPERGTVNTTHGLGRADVSNAADAGVVGRGVLLDVGRQMGTEGPNDSWLPLDATGTDEDAAVTLADLQATAETQGTEIREHDIVLIRTGAIERTNDPDAEWHPLGEPGLTYTDDLIEWVHGMEIPYMGADNLAVEQVTHTVSEDDLSNGREGLAGTYVLPIHGAFLRDLGVTINEVMDLSGLAEQCAADGIYEFLFAAAPLHVEMGTGAPVNPIVIKATEEGSMDDGGTEVQTETEGSMETDTEPTAATGDGFGAAATALGLVGLAGAVGRRATGEDSTGGPSE